MQVKVLGSAAGGGFPQWNCRCENCLGIRKGTISAQDRTQSSIAVSANGTDWILFNASPDIRQQLLRHDIFMPASGLRGCTIKAIVLTDAQLDHTAGLLFLREGGPLTIYGTPAVFSDLTQGFPVFRILEHYCGIRFQTIDPGRVEAVFAVEGVDDLLLEAVPLRSKAPPYSPHRNNSQVGDTIGIQVHHLKKGKRLLYVPGLGCFEPHLDNHFAGSDCVLVDGTFWDEEEMLHRGVGHKKASDMGHMPLAGPGGTLEFLSRFPNTRKVLIHINNTNPILNEHSWERQVLGTQGVEVAYDGMDISL